MVSEQDQDQSIWRLDCMVSGRYTPRCAGMCLANDSRYSVLFTIYCFFLHFVQRKRDNKICSRSSHHSKCSLLDVKVSRILKWNAVRAARDVPCAPYHGHPSSSSCLASQAPVLFRSPFTSIMFCLVTTHSGMSVG